MSDDILTELETKRLFRLMHVWREEDLRMMQHYEPGNCLPHLSLLLDIPYRADSEGIPRIEKRMPGLLRALLGPHGKTIMKVLVIRYEERQKEKTNA